MSGATAPVDDDVPVSRDITEWRVLGYLFASIGALLALGATLRAVHLEGPPLPLNIGAKLLTATIALSLVDRLGWWRRVGFRTPSRWSRLWLGWLPLLYVASAFSLGIPTDHLSRLAGILALSLAIGLDEEVWTRGLLLEALRHRGTTVAVIGSAVAFGLLHLVNIAGGQAVSTTFLQVAVAIAFGLALGALRVRCHSIWPAVLVHAAWDFAGIARTDELVATEGVSGHDVLGVLLRLAPLAIYGLVLARPSKVPGPDGRLRRPAGPAAPVVTAPTWPAAPTAPPADALGRWPAAPPEVEALRRGP